MTYKTHAIVLAKKDIRENSRVYILYSRNVGKVEAMARGSRKILSKLAQHLEPPIFSDVMIARGKRIDKLAGATSFSSYPKIKSDLFKIQIVFSCFQTLDSLTRPNQKDTRLWQMLEKFLKICEDADKNVFKERGGVLQNAFFIKLLAVLGFNFVDYLEKENIKSKTEELGEVKYLLEKKFEEILNSSFKISDKTKESIALYLEMHIR